METKFSTIKKILEDKKILTIFTVFFVGIIILMFILFVVVYYCAEPGKKISFFKVEFTKSESTKTINLKMKEDEIKVRNGIILSNKQTEEKIITNNQSNLYDGDNLLDEIDFSRGGNIDFNKNKSLTIFKSNGWMVGNFKDDIDIGERSIFHIEYISKNACEIFLEMKSWDGIKEEPLIGRISYNNWPKVKLIFKSTRGQSVVKRIDLNKHILKVENKMAHSIIFSDPSNDIEIISIRYETSM